MEYREYGSSGDVLSIVAFAGIVVSNETPEDSEHYVSWAIDQGINYFDVAPSYGNAQSMLGPVLEPYRKDVFLACKTNKRDAPTAQMELEESLRLLRTDHFDLYQLHAMSSEEDLEIATGPGGEHLKCFYALEKLARYDTLDFRHIQQKLPSNL